MENGLLEWKLTHSPAAEVATFLINPHKPCVCVGTGLAVQIIYDAVVKWCHGIVTLL